MEEAGTGVAALDPIGVIRDFAAQHLGVMLELLASLLAILLLLGLRWLWVRRVDRKDLPSEKRYRLHKRAQYVTNVALVVALALIWLPQTGGDVLTYLGLVSAGMAIALRDPIANLLGWMFIQWREPFGLGDRVEIDGRMGDVVDINYFMFALMEVGGRFDAEQSTGRILHVPNGLIFQRPVSNFTQGSRYIWHEIPVTLTFESDWRRAKGILDEVGRRHCLTASSEAEEQLRRAARRFNIAVGTLTPKVYTKVVDHGIRLSLRHLVPARELRGIQERIWEDVLDAFAAEPAIAFAYPTQRVVLGDHQPARPLDGEGAGAS